ncbi:hypothetical protein SEUCBS140593_010656 [Sporothrix eucalyptigena]|uniref:Zn(2)-C6 fungal-type domain-containing protein n=1 Tax=Sporothrix eucalyptigena TaxID=1812306 RepID=A0ABP0D2F6_9PEZI
MPQNAPSSPSPAPSATPSAVAPSQTPREPAPATAPAPPTGTTGAASGSTHTERILACVMCQQRKVKCNRKFPCNNCIRLGVNCVPATLNPRRRRRRFPERELLDRVRHYETLLRQNNVRFESLFETTTGIEEDPQTHHDDDASHDAASSLAALRHGGSASGRDEMMVDADGDDAGRVKTTGSDAGLSVPPPTTKTVWDRGVEAKNFWKAIRKGFIDSDFGGVGASRERRSHNDSNNGNTPDGGGASAASPASTSDAESDEPNAAAVIREMWARQLGNTGSLFFRGPHKTLASITALHPGPVQIFRLWQIYLENVDPLLKITHTPSLQGRIVEAASNLEGIDPTLEALLFGIYCVAIHSMTSSDCQAVFGSSKQDLLGTYQPACEQALLNSGFLRTTERDCLAAFFLYLISLGHNIDHRTLFSMLGVAMRIAQSMQINNDTPSTTPKLAPLEAEMRRRLWWAMALFDARIGELSNHSPTMLDPTWDCSIPLNANDFDFRPELKEPPSSVAATGGRSVTSSEALFVVVRSELANAMRQTEYYLALTNPALRPLARDREFATAAHATSPDGHARRKEFAELDALEDMIHSKYLQYCDPANGLHYMTIWIAKGFIAKCRLIKYFAKFSQYSVQPQPQQSSDGTSTNTTEPTPNMRDLALQDALTVVEADTNIMTSHLTRGYRWLVHLYFPLPAYIYITQELARRVGGKHATQAWATMNANYEARFALADSEDRYMFKMFAGTILQAWNACEARAQADGDPPPSVPEMVQRVRSQLVETNDAEAAASNTTNSLGGGMDGTAVSSGDVLGTFPTTLSMGIAPSSLFGGAGSGPPPPGSGPPSAFGGATPPAPPLFPSPNLGSMSFGMPNVANWPPMPMPWGWGPRPSWPS